MHLCIISTNPSTHRFLYILVFVSDYQSSICISHAVTVILKARVASKISILLMLDASQCMGESALLSQAMFHSSVLSSVFMIVELSFFH